MHLEFQKMLAVVVTTVFAYVAVVGAAPVKTVHPSSFAASTAIDVLALLSASEKLGMVPAHATYPMSIKNYTDTSTIHSDWASFQEGAAFVFKADMDTDCDGLDYKCDGNADGQPLTNWGSLSAFEVPFIVIPQTFMTANPAAIPGNNVAAVICNKKMFYAILGDTNGNDPQVTGEASWILARSCFPEENLSGSRGHDEYDVTYILFTGPEAALPSTALNEHYITDFDKLRSMGDHLTTALLTNLGVSSLPLSPGSSPHDDGVPEDLPNTENASSAVRPGPSDSGAAPESQHDFESVAAASNVQAPELTLLFITVISYVCVIW
ncbi:fungal chitosanase of glycosyl hydrolase group 75-domain-containing protein [Aspergillus unguis]